MQNSTIGNIIKDENELSDPYKLQQLSKALIKFSMQDGDRASQELSVRLSNIQTQLSTLEMKLDAGMDAEEVKINIKLTLDELLQCFIGLQFFDRISQRMDHAIKSVDGLSEEEAVQNNIADWFTMEDERILYAAILQGDTVESAVQKASAKLINIVDNNDDDVELF